MSNSILAEYSKLLLTLYRQAQELPIHEFQDRVLESIKACLPFDTSIWGTARMTPAGIDVHSLHLHKSSQDMLDAYGKVKHMDGTAARMTRQPTATMAFNAEADFPGPELAPYRAFLHAFGHENMLITSDIHPVTRFAHWVALNRASAVEPFTADQTEMFSCIAPHLMQALAINRLVHLGRLTGDVAREKWTVAITDSRGVIYHADKRFRELVALEWPASADYTEHLPGALLKQLMAQDDHVTGQRVVVRRSLENSLLFLKARERERVDDLTAREFLVGSLLVSGLTQKQVAVKLERSPETVRTQVKRIFDKLKINNVAMLAPLLMLRD